MSIHDAKDFINSVGYPIVSALILAYIVYKMWVAQKKVLDSITDTNQKLTDTNRSLVEKVNGKIDALEDKVDKIVDKILE